MTSPSADKDGQWKLVTIDDTPVGFELTWYQDVEENGHVIRLFGQDTDMLVPRKGISARIRNEIVIRQSAQGDLLGYHCLLSEGTIPTKIEGIVEGSNLTIRAISGQTVQTQTIPIPKGIGGPDSIELSLRKSPLQEGGSRKVRYFEPTFGCLITAVLGDEGHETVELLKGEKKRLQRLNVLMQMETEPPVSIGFTYWVDATGQAEKITCPGLRMSLYHTDKKTALAGLQGGNMSAESVFDFASVKTDRPIDNPYGTRRAEYRIHLAKGDPAKELANVYPTEIMTKIDQNTILLTVAEDRLEKGKSPFSVHQQPTAADRQPNNRIQSNDPRIVQMANEAAPDGATPLATALALEQYVFNFITNKNFSKAFASAAEVAADPRGDCTEHAVLLAALCRARGIPARVVLGLMYSQQEEAFVYHLWTEAWIDGQWRQLDATLAHGGIDAAHIRLSTSPLAGVTENTLNLSLVNLLGRMTIKVERVEYGR